MAKLERDNDALRDELDSQEQYSRQNCLLLNGMTKRRAELLGKACAKAGVKVTWTADGRIICLLEDGRKIAIDTPRDLSDRIA